MNIEQLKKLGKGVWPVVSEAMTSVHEGRKKIHTYASIKHPLALSVVRDAERAVNLTEKAIRDIRKATEAQSVYQLCGQLRKHLKRFDMRREDCAFLLLDSYLVSIGETPTDFGSALVRDIQCFPLVPKDNRIKTQYSNSPVYCEHANEMPATCPCSLECYCKFNACKSPTRAAIHRVVLS